MTAAADDLCCCCFRQSDVFKCVQTILFCTALHIASEDIKAVLGLSVNLPYTAV